MFEKKVYIERRKQLQHAVGSGLVVLLGNEESSMNYKDNLYPFRQHWRFNCQTQKRSLVFCSTGNRTQKDDTFFATLQTRTP